MEMGTHTEPNTELLFLATWIHMDGKSMNVSHQYWRNMNYESYCIWPLKRDVFQNKEMSRKPFAKLPYHQKNHTLPNHLLDVL